jgi:hypothetical protein
MFWILLFGWLLWRGVHEFGLSGNGVFGHFRAWFGIFKDWVRIDEGDCNLMKWDGMDHER